MKLHRSHSSRSGFTLVELLVVIAIIGILASVLIPGIMGALNQARRTKAATIANQIQTGMTAYQTEYSVYPNPNPNANTPQDTYYDGDPANGYTLWGPLTIALCGDVDPLKPSNTQTPSPELNSHHVAFLNPQYGDLDGSKGTGVIKQPFTSIVTGKVQYFYMAVDTDYSGILGDTPPVQGNLPKFSSTTWTNTTFKSAGVDLNGQTTQGIAVWCNNDQPPTGNKSNPSFWGHTY